MGTVDSDFSDEENCPGGDAENEISNDAPTTVAGADEGSIADGADDD